MLTLLCLGVMLFTSCNGRFNTARQPDQGTVSTTPQTSVQLTKSVDSTKAVTSTFAQITESPITTQTRAAQITNGITSSTETAAPSTSAESDSDPSTETEPDTIPLPGAADHPFAAMADAWGDKVERYTIEDFSDSYLALGYAPIRDNGDLPVIVKGEAIKGLGILNVFTKEVISVAQTEPAYSYGYSGGNDRYVAAFRYTRSVHPFPVPIEFIIYDTETDSVQTVDVSSLEMADGGSYVHPYVSIYDGAIYFELQDRERTKNEAGEVTEYGLSIYKYTLATKSLEKLQDYGSAPTMTADGLYFMAKSTDKTGGSLYFTEGATADTIELIPNCGEYQIAEDNSILFTRKFGTSLSVGRFADGAETELFVQENITGWDFRYNGRMVCWSHNSAPLYLYDSQLGQTIRLSEIKGANLCIPSDKYLVWYELRDENVGKMNNPPRKLCIVDISRLMAN